MDEIIRHEGIVTGVTRNVARVTIVQTSACAACKAQSMCMSSEKREKEMDVIVASPIQVGDRVEVEVREQLAWKAVLLAYILPFVVMIGVLLVLNRFTDWSEAVTGTLSLCAIALYYLVLSMFRHKLQKQFTFTGRKV